ncbi:MAG: alpha-glucan family phosphorylase, partial [Gemmatimonadales bacterium]
ERLRRLLTDVQHPVQIVFGGKAHPADDPAKEILQRVYSFTRDPRFEGRVAFLEDYDLFVAARLVRGVDLWLNLPRPPLEASGTSGMKAALNAVPQLATLDGWWAEGFEGENGWALPLAEPGADEEEVDNEDVRALFELLEREVVPLYYDRDESGLPRGWLRKMKQALRIAGARFTTRRMVQQYALDYYAPALVGELNGDDRPTG